MRIASLCPSNTELLAFMGLTSSIVGVDKYSDWPPAIGALPRLGSDMDIDIEALEALKPDLIVASLTVPGMEKNIERLKDRNLPYIILNPKSLEDIANNMLVVGEATNTLKQATAAASKYRQVLEQYAELSRKVGHKPSLYWEWWPKPVFTPGGGNWLTEISELAGARNVFADDPRASVKTEPEDVLSRIPDYILLAWVGVKAQQVKPESVKKREGWSRLDAVQQGRIHVMEEPLYCRPSPRLIVGLQKLAAFLHPDVYPAYDPVESEMWFS
ncbi:ABC transporter substrate-binding protein [Cohnella herbarum]|uniref:Cobalamin-binding protein n=1 Tax=Cohnella herbarum TaxID=2728023 RepID=A0A7Z2VKW3_9BACL|nr:cobalamin-binding protein [Cohnella herbarum]QJD84939.1 cobalamin-binding protein [Cohnella herbarum]